LPPKKLDKGCGCISRSYGTDVLENVLEKLERRLNNKVNFEHYGNCYISSFISKVYQNNSQE